MIFFHPKSPVAVTWIGAHIVDGPEMLELAQNQTRQVIHRDVRPPQCASIIIEVIQTLFKQIVSIQSYLIWF